MRLNNPLCQASRFVLGKVLAQSQARFSVGPPCLGRILRRSTDKIVTHAVLNGLAATSIKQRHLTARTRAWLKLREEDGCANARLVLLEGQKGTARFVLLKMRSSNVMFDFFEVLKQKSVYAMFPLRSLCILKYS